MKNSVTTPVLRYIPKSRRKEGESPFAGHQVMKVDQRKKKVDETTLQCLKQEVVVPLPRANHNQIAKPPTSESVDQSRRKWLNKGKFDPNAYKLLANSGYDFENPASMGNVIEVEPHGINDTQKKLQEYGVEVRPTKVGLGFEAPTPIKISARRRGTTSSSQYITAEEVEENEGEEGATQQKISVFDRIQSPVIKNHTSVFDRLGGNELNEGHEAPESDEEMETDEAPKTLEDGGQATVDELKELNLGTQEEPRPVYVRDARTRPESRCPSFSHQKGCQSKEAIPKTFQARIIPEIEAEVNKLIDAGFIREVKYPTWIANIVPIRKENGQLRVCVDFRDLNEACPKDDFPLPVTEIMIDATTGHEALSFMDCTAGYNQIHMAPEDQEATAFRTPKGIFCYKVMPFGLKNAGAMYQRAMQKIFEDMMHQIVECYVDDLVVKSKKKENHLLDLRQVFERLRKWKLKMNPLKCAFGVTSGKFLGFIVRHRGIEIDQEPKNLKELRGLQGRLAYIRRFISNLAGRCHHFSHLMKKDAPFKWDDSCKKAFESIKKYLSSPPVLGAPIKGNHSSLIARRSDPGAMCLKSKKIVRRQLFII
ncbi:uncharacterized protein LOC130589519 [Beta vulgaris subsp. vulgaris]|uniref:uncharacterized protein LOC130589519 n=1 Tax=Beta vulgaris subsp. vulgaris TaxID=3555 RepID=UPI002548BC1D|nr:uncharacterized protein LOC130589519 [Beta vulgaris subsp. vulgaris]